MTYMPVNEPADRRLPPWYRRHVRRIVLALLASAVTLVLLGQFLVLPWLLRQRIVAALDEAGVKGVSFHVTRATLWGSQLRDVTAGDGSALMIDRIDLDYRLPDLK